MKRVKVLWLVQGRPKGNYSPVINEVYQNSQLANGRADFLRKLHDDVNFGVYKCEAYI